MPWYYVNNRAQSNGDHEVHQENCPFLPMILSKKDLGYHTSCQSAVIKAKETYPTANGCRTCSPQCHTS